MDTPGNNQAVATRQTPPGGDLIKLDMATVQGFEALQRAGKLLSMSTLVPVVYRHFILNKEGERTGENPSAFPNCVVAMNMAARMGADPLMVCQNMNIIEGRPSWSSTFVIASINQCGRFSPLRYDLSPLGEETDVSYKFTEWVDGANGKRRPEEKTGTLQVRHQTCRAWAIEKATGTRLDGPEVSMQMAVDEGWVQKKGSKWRTMQEVMLRYRAASFFGKLYAPELLMGLQTREELEDIIELDAATGEVLPSATTARPHAKVVTSLDWSIEALEAFDDLMGKAYAAFKGAGYATEYQTFADSWQGKRGKTAAADTLESLRAAVEPLLSAAVAVADQPEVTPDPAASKHSTTGVKHKPLMDPPAPTGINPDPYAHRNDPEEASLFDSDNNGGASK